MNNATLPAAIQILFKATVAAAARAVGASEAAALRIVSFVDRTDPYADYTGWAFVGASPEVCERAALHFEASLRRHDVPCRGQGGRWYYSRYSNNADGWSQKAPTVKVGEKAYPNSPTSTITLEESLEGFAVLTGRYSLGD